MEWFKEIHSSLQPRNSFTSRLPEKDLPVPQSIMHPSIDPLSPKNMDLSQSVVDRELNKIGIEPSLPIITQVSRFDKWKDPFGVIDVFEKIRNKFECQLVLIGEMATDDPEGPLIFENLLKHIEGKENIKIFTDASDIAVNAIQRASKVVIQKSIREGFGLTVTEALWKRTPVVASNFGGITLQVEDGISGYLIQLNDNELFVKRILSILKDEKTALKMGERGQEHVRKNFLVTRQILDYITL